MKQRTGLQFPGATIIASVIWTTLPAFAEAASEAAAVVPAVPTCPPAQQTWKDKARHAIEKS